MTAVHENLAYKTEDHLFRSADEYAQGKYDVTTRWLRPLVRSGQLLLNVGCGSGEYNGAARSMGLRVIACEPETKACALAQSNSPDGVDVRQCGLLDLDSEPADYLVMHDVLEHIEDDVAAVAKVHSLLAPGGTAIISVPAYQWLFGRHDVELGHFRRYNQQNLRALFTRDFEIEATRYYGAALIPIALWFSRLTNKPYPVAAAGRGFTRRAMRWVCQLESRVPMPVGTSVLLRARKLA
jgi:2-polyprenyl-3-methyl-5-hydroxy-6-metoxy-1,4-benzoquinol methylase